MQQQINSASAAEGFAFRRCGRPVLGLWGRDPVRGRFPIQWDRLQPVAAPSENDRPSPNPRP